MPVSKPMHTGRDPMSVVTCSRGWDVCCTCRIWESLRKELACRLVAEDDPWAADPSFLVEVAVSRFERQKSQTEIVNAMPLYPTESILWDENQVPQVHYTGVHSRSSLGLLRKCGLQVGWLFWWSCTLPLGTDRWNLLCNCKARRAWRCRS